MSRTVNVILSIDTEADDMWAPGAQLSFRNLDRLPEFQEFCAGLGLRPTYLVAYEVIGNDRAREVIQQLARQGNCEIGAHLHAWLTPPYYEALEPPGKRPYLHEYPEELRLAKLETVTTALEQALAARPISYRGGRWSMDPFTMRALDARGYLADTTVTPFVSWARTLGTNGRGPNFAGAPYWPYHPAADDPTSPGQFGILEVPPSHRPKGIVPYSLYRALGRRFGNSPRAWRFALRRFLDRLCQVVQPNPALAPAAQLLWLAKRVALEKIPVLNLAFHSSELIAGGAPWLPPSYEERAVRVALAAVAGLLTQVADWTGSTLAQFAQPGAA